MTKNKNETANKDKNIGVTSDEVREDKRVRPRQSKNTCLLD